jgi:hypothetical protein
MCWRGIWLKNEFLYVKVMIGASIEKDFGLGKKTVIWDLSQL